MKLVWGLVDGDAFHEKMKTGEEKVGWGEHRFAEPIGLGSVLPLTHQTSLQRAWPIPESKPRSTLLERAAGTPVTDN